MVQIVLIFALCVGAALAGGKNKKNHGYGKTGQTSLVTFMQRIFNWAEFSFSTCALKYMPDSYDYGHHDTYGYSAPSYDSYAPSTYAVASYSAPSYSTYSAPSYSAPSYSAPAVYTAPSYAPASSYAGTAYHAPSYSYPTYYAPQKSKGKGRKNKGGKGGKKGK